MKKLSWVALLAVLVALVYLFVPVRSPVVEPVGVTSQESAPEEEVPREPPSVAVSAEPEPPSELEERLALETQVEASAFHVHGVVLSGARAPLEGAEVALTLLTTKDADWEPAFQGDDWGALARTKFVTVTDPRGEFDFRLGGEHAGASFCAWATASGFVSALAEGAIYAGQPALQLVLAEGKGLEVLVVDSEGRGVGGAAVEQWGLVETGALPAETAARAQRHWSHRVLTDAAGRANLAELGGEQVVVARAGASISAPWRGRAPAVVRLQLEESFELSGTVTLPDWTHLEYEGELRLTVAAMSGNVPQVVASVRDIQAGEFGPLGLPLLPGATRYRVRLEGSPIIPIDAYLDAPAPGESRRLDLAADLGHRVWLIAHDVETGETITNSRVRLEWEAPTYTQPRGFVERAAMSNGYLNVWSVPPGQVTYTISAPGYVTQRGPWIEIPMEEEITLLMELERGAPLQGRVVRNGGPVERFQLTYWRTNLDQLRVVTEFTTIDGRFELQAVPSGTLWFAAASDGCLTLAPVRVQIPAAGLQDLVLEVGEARTGRGRIVASGSGAPVEGARVQPQVPGGVYALHPFGRPLETNASGKFSGAGFVPGRNFITVVAPGFHEVAREVTLDPSGASDDLGTIEIGRAGRLELRLIGPSGVPANIGGLGLRGKNNSLGLAKFDAAGVAVYEDVAPGKCHLMFMRPDGDMENWQLDLQAGEDPWIFERTIESERSAVLEILGDSRQLASLMAAVMVERSDLGSVTRIRDLHGPTEPLLFESVGSDEIQCFLATGPEDYVGSANAAFEVEDEVWMTIDLDEEPLQVRVSDAAGAPVEGVILRVYSEQDTGLCAYGISTAAGEALLYGVPREAVVVNAWHEARGALPRLPFDASTRTLALTLENAASIALRVVTAGKPVQGAEVGLSIIRDSIQEGSVRSGPDGRAVYRGLAEQSYRVRFSKDGHWKTFVELPASADPAEVTVELPRKADLMLATRTAEGTPLPGLEVELTYEPTGERVRDWILAERLEGEAPRTDALGLAKLVGVPCGTYRWGVLRDGQRVEGTLSVSADRANRAELVLP